MTRITPKNEDRGDREELWKQALEELKKAMIVYGSVAKKGDEKEIQASAEEVVKKMRNLGATHTDPEIKKEWDNKADRFAKAGKAERGIMSNDIIQGLILLLATPFLLAGAVVFAAGSIIYGAGSIVRGLGNLMTFGKLGGANEEPGSAAED